MGIFFSSQDDYYTDSFYSSYPKKGISVIVSSVGEASPYITSSLTDNVQRQLVVQVSGPPNLTHIQTSALTVTACALSLSRLLSEPSSPTVYGVLTPVCVFGIDFLSLLEQSSVSVQILRSKRLTDPDIQPILEEPLPKIEQEESTFSSLGVYTLWGGLQF